METPLLQTKCHIPLPRTNLVSRPQLIRRLNEGLEQNFAVGRKLTLIAAPAGFGKTTLATDWLQQQHRPMAWLSLDEGDNDPTRFLRYCVAAIQTAQPTVGKLALAMLASSQPPPSETILTSLMNDLAEQREAIVFVLDDYHLIENQTIHNALIFLLDKVPPQLHLVILSRADPPVPLSRLRARGQLLELRQADLRFTVDEATIFLNQIMGLNLTETQISALESRTEGWIASLQLAALSMKDQFDTATFIQQFSGSHRYVLDYLTDEVFSHQPEQIQQFLLQTAILPRLSGPLCDAVLASGDGSVTALASSQHLLEQLETANLFLIPLDHQRHWYRYHHLFQTFLQMRLRQSDVHVAGLHQRAAAWFAEQGDIPEAIDHLLAADELQQAAALITENALNFLNQGQAITLLRWLDRLPDAAFSQWLMLSVNRAWALLSTGQIHIAETEIQRLETALNPANSSAMIAGHLAALQATIAAMQRQVEPTVVYAQQALDILPPSEKMLRAIIAWNLAFAYRLKGDYVAAREQYQVAIDVAQQVNNRQTTILALIGLGNLQAAQCQYQAAIATYQRALTIGQLDSGHVLPAVLEAHEGLARIAYERCDRAALQYHLEQAHHILTQAPNHDLQIPLLILEAKQNEADGNLAQADRILHEAAKLVKHHHLQRREVTVAEAQAALLLRQGDLQAALRLAQNHHLPLSQARVHLALREIPTALAILATFTAVEQRQANIMEADRLKALVYQALALQADQQPTAAHRCLQQALTLAEPNLIKRMFVDEGQPMLTLLRQAQAQNRSINYIDQLLPLFGISNPQPDSLIEPLSSRELEVLGLVAAGLTNQEIADHHVVALSTVKWHIRNIYGKLQVRNRAEAIAAARALNLLPE